MHTHNDSVTPKHIAALALLALTGCTPVPIRLLTDNPDAAFAAEVYAHQSGVPVELVFRANVTAALTQEQTSSTLVIAEWINNPAATASVQRLPRRVRAVQADQTAILNADERLVALAFRPYALATAQSLTLPSSDAIGADLLGSVLTDDQSESNTDLSAIAAFGADGASIYGLLLGFGFAEEALVNQDGGIAWPVAAFDAAIAATFELRTAVHGSVEAELVFAERFLYESWERHLATDRLGIALVDGAVALHAPPESLERVQLRWLADRSQQVLAHEAVAWSGIVRGSGVRERRESARMLQWLLDPAVQRQFVADAQAVHATRFGFLGGFSTSDVVNEYIATELRPDLPIAAPPVASIRWPGMRPRYWNEAMTEVIEPFLRNEATDAERASQLASRLRVWYDQRGD